MNAKSIMRLTTAVCCFSSAIAVYSAKIIDVNYDDLNNEKSVIAESISLKDSSPSPELNINIPPETLNEIVSHVDPDSIRAYIEVLESFAPRVVGSTGNAQARDWLISKLENYGYTPVLDTFAYGIFSGHNLMAYHQGISCPDNYIVIGAHYDAVPGSPGACDDGSGVAGVLEIARILDTQNTNFSFLLALFDGEEVGVVGSSYMADRLYTNGDSIALMLNMDEIGWNGGYSNTVRLFYGPNNNYAQLYGQLASTLPSINLNSTMMGSTYYSDHYPFQSRDINSLFVYSYPTSPYRHTPRDSGTYVNFAYTARIVRGVLATALELDDQLAPGPSLAFSYPEGLPEYIVPGEEVSIKILVSGLAGGVPVAGKGMMYYSTDGLNYSARLLDELGDGLLDVPVPVLDCSNSAFWFYVSVQESGGMTYFEPSPGEPLEIPIGNRKIIAWTDDFEETTGWHSFEGAWAIGSPTGAASEFGAPDPVGGRNSTLCLGFNLNGDYENDLPALKVISPPINCRGLNHVHLKFWRWLGVQFYGYDYARIAVSTDGINFTYFWFNHPEFSGGYWWPEEVDISQYADNQPEVYIAFVMGPTDAGWQYCGWNIDDIEISGYQCRDWICGDHDDDGQVNIIDIIFLINHKFKYGPAPDPLESADVNHDGTVNILDIIYMINFKFKAGPEPVCP